MEKILGLKIVKARDDCSNSIDSQRVDVGSGSVNIETFLELGVVIA